MSTNVEILAHHYLLHLAAGRALSGAELAEAERAYVLWDWNGLASLAYDRYLRQGRGAFVGPRIAADESSVTVVFDYTPDPDAQVAQRAGPDLATALRVQVEHYHPELDFVVVWLRPDGTARHEVLHSNQAAGLHAPRDAYRALQAQPPRRPN